MNEGDLFMAALQIEDAAERSAHLDRACAGEAVLRQRVEALLAAFEKAGSFLQQPAGDPRTASYAACTGPSGDGHPDEEPGTLIGPYKLIKPIGEGGMGAVWMAQQQEPVRRAVALKVIKAGMDTRAVLARFEQERQALALMDHPNIAKVLDAGATPRGRPYFVMELVKGTPITRYCDDHRLPPKDRLGLFVQVCQAVQHAHQKGVIHRDLKPSNVLVAPYDGKPVVKVIDFGVAKAAGQPLTEKTLMTEFGAVIGTPEYMSPEQAELNNADIDTRSDVYSLGVLLYELITGTTPLQKRRMREVALLEVLRLVREEEPPRPSTRLSTTAELPSVAGSRGVEPAKLTRLVRGELDWIVMKALEKDRARRYDTANAFAADLERYLADEPVQACPPTAGYRLRKFARRNKGGLAAAGLALAVLVLLGSGVGWALRDRAARHADVAGRVESILAEADRLAGEQDWPGALAAARRAEAAAAGGEADPETAGRVRERLKDFELVERLEQARMKGATWTEGHFDYAGAAGEYARAFRDYGVDVEELPVEESARRLKARPALAVPLAAALDDWAFSRGPAAGGDPDGWRRLTAVARAIDPDLLRNRLRSTWGRPAPEVRDDLRQLADSIDVRAQQPGTIDLLARSLQRVGLRHAALRVLRDSELVYPGDFWLRFQMGVELGDQNDPEGAIRAYTAAVSIRPRLAAPYNNLGNSWLGRGNPDEAVACLRKAIELDPKYAVAHINLGVALFAQQKPDEAIACYRQALALDPKSGPAHYNLGRALLHQQKPDEAAAAFRTALALNPDDGRALNNLGALAYFRKDSDGAVAYFRRAIEANRKVGRKDPNPHANLGAALIGRKRLDEAVAACRAALALDPKHEAATSNLAGALNELARPLATDADAAKRDPGRAVTLAGEAVELKPQEGKYWATLGAARYRAGDWKGAIAALEKSTELRKGGDGSDWLFLAMAHWQLGEKDKAREWYDRAVQWTDKNKPADEELRRLRAEAAELLELTEKE